MALRRASRFYRLRSASFTLLILCGLSLGTGACGTILGAEDEYVVGAPTDGAGGAVTGGGGGVGGGASGAPPGGGSAGASAGQGTGASGGSAGASGAAAGSGGTGGGGASQAGQSGQAGTASGGQSGVGGFGGVTASGSGGAAGSNVGGASNGGSAGASGGSGGSNGGAAPGGNGGTSSAGSAGATSGGSAGATSGGAAGSTNGGSAGTTSGGQGGSAAGTGATGGTGGSGGAPGGTGGTGGAAGAGGGSTDTCCLAEVAAFTKQLVDQYEKSVIFTGFSYDPPNPSACYEYLTPVDSTSSIIRFAAKSNIKGCASLAIEVAAVTGKGNKNAVGAACVTSNTMATTVTAAVNYCVPAAKIVCHTAIVQGEAITSAACTEATCNSCLTAGTASVKAWIKAQDDYFVSKGVYDVAMAPPADTACYDYTFVYKDPSTVKLAAAAKSAVCTSLAGRADGKAVMGLPGLPPTSTTRFSGICSSPTNATFAALVSDTWGVVGDCERAARGPATIACEAGATPVAGTGAVARSDCGPE